MDNVIVGIIGTDSRAADLLYSGLRAFPASKVILVFKPKCEARAMAIKKDLEKVKIPVAIEPLAQANLESLFQTVFKIRNNEMGKHIILNIDTDTDTSCIALSAAFVNGIQAIGIKGDGGIIAYPIMKFSYYSALSDKKMSVLRTIEENSGVESLEQLSRLLKMSLPLVTYHVRGTRNSSGLEELGLVETKRNKGRIGVMLSSLGKLVLRGYVEVESNQPGKAKAKKPADAKVKLIED